MVVVSIPIYTRKEASLFTLLTLNLLIKYKYITKLFNEKKLDGENFDLPN